MLTPGLLHGTRDLGGRTALILLHTVVSFVLTLLAFAPMAFLIALAFPRRWSVVAAAAGLWLIAPALYVIPDIWKTSVDHADYTRTLIMLVLIIFTALLGSTYFAWRLTSNNRWRGP